MIVQNEALICTVQIRVSPQRKQRLIIFSSVQADNRDLSICLYVFQQHRQWFSPDF